MQSADTKVEARLVETKQSTASKKLRIPTAIKCVFSGALIYWVLWGSNPGEILMAVSSANILLLVLSFVMKSVMVTYLRAYRWRVLLKTQGVDASIPFLLNSYMVSFFFSNFLPSTIGGDAVRVYDTWRIGNSKVGAMAVVFVERFLGILALMLFALVALPMSKQLTADLPFLHLWILLGTAGMLLFVWITFMPSQQLLTLVAKIRLSVSRRVESILDMIINAFLAFEGRKGTLTWALSLSLIMQAGVILHYYLIAKALDFPVPLHDFFLIIPLAILIMMVPVSINAIGIRENVLVFFFATFGVATSKILALSLLVYGTVVLTGLLGGIVYALRR